MPAPSPATIVSLPDPPLTTSLPDPPISVSSPPRPESVSLPAPPSIVSAASLARLGERLNLGDYLILGRGEEKTGGRRKLALIADCFEALIAAVYLDGGIEAAQGFIQRMFEGQIEDARKIGAAYPTSA